MPLGLYTIVNSQIVCIYLIPFNSCFCCPFLWVLFLDLLLILLGMFASRYLLWAEATTNILDAIMHWLSVHQINNFAGLLNNSPHFRGACQGQFFF